MECLFDIGSDIKNRPLGKFRTDIAKELGLISNMKLQIVHMSPIR